MPTPVRSKPAPNGCLLAEGSRPELGPYGDGSLPHRQQHRAALRPPVLPEGDDPFCATSTFPAAYLPRPGAIQAEVAAILAWTEHVTHLPDIIAAGRRDGVTARRGSSLDEFAQLTTMPDGPAAPLVRALQTAIGNYVRTVIAEELRHVDLIADAETKFAHGDHSQRVSAAVIQGPWGKAAVCTNYLLERMAARDPR